MLILTKDRQWIEIDMPYHEYVMEEFQKAMVKSAALMWAKIDAEIEEAQAQARDDKVELNEDDLRV